jgi:hypothetical protein
MGVSYEESFFDKCLAIELLRFWGQTVKFSIHDKQQDVLNISGEYIRNSLLNGDVLTN